MSRIGKKPITIPAGIDVKVDDHVVTVTKGNESLSQEVDPRIDVQVKDGVVELFADDEQKSTKALHRSGRLAWRLRKTSSKMSSVHRAW